MGVYKDEKTNTWFAKFYYKDWKGERKQTTKRGFATKRDAKQWEAEFIASKTKSLHVDVATFVEMYFEDKKNELKERSITNKQYMINKYVIPFFKEKKIDEIVPADIIQWQDQIIQHNFSKTYQRMLQNQVTAIFSHAAKIYGLRDNPCKQVKKIGDSDAERIDFWTVQEYEQFIAHIEKDDKYCVLFEMLFFTGMRIGECLALSLNDISFEKKEIYISKTYYRHKKEDVLTTPKTRNSIRTIYIPDFLVAEIKEYTDKLYAYPRDARIFAMIPKAVENKMKRTMEKAGVKKIRVHDLRHSHVSYLINQGVEPLLIKERLGHKDIKITLNTYGHLYPSRQRAIADLLEQKKNT